MLRLPGRHAVRAEARTLAALVVVLALGACTAAERLAPFDRRAAATPAASAEPAAAIHVRPARGVWSAAIDAAIGARDVSVAVGVGRRIVYTHLGSIPRVLASNEKLLTSMAALELLGPAFRFATTAEGTDAAHAGVIRADLWLVGGGDPTLTPGDLARLAAAVRAAGVRRVDGAVVGDTGAFDRGWWAPGWIRGVSRSYVARPTALRLIGAGAVPEAEAAAAFRTALLGAGVRVRGGSRIGDAPPTGTRIAAIHSPPLRDLLVHQNHESDNLFAEMLTKALGADGDLPASTAGGAIAVRRWARATGVDAAVRDGSGLSDQDRTPATGIVRLLLLAHREPWFPSFVHSLPATGQGTLAGRLTGVRARAKTGTLFIRPASTLSGYVTSRTGGHLAFSVLTHDLSEATAVAIEDAVVRALAASSLR